MLHVIHSDGFKFEQTRQSLRLDTSTSHNASSTDTQRDVLGSRHVTGSLLFGRTAPSAFSAKSIMSDWVLVKPLSKICTPRSHSREPFEVTMDKLQEAVQPYSIKAAMIRRHASPINDAHCQVLK